jgi:hypothetical protein
MGKIRRVLIVEDEWLLAETMQDIVCGCGFEVAGPVPSVARAQAILG